MNGRGSLREGMAKQGSPGPLYSRGGHGGLGGSPTTPVWLRET
jgi:hypothetical protein